MRAARLAVDDPPQAEVAAQRPLRRHGKAQRRGLVRPMTKGRQDFHLLALDALQAGRRRRHLVLVGDGDALHRVVTRGHGKADVLHMAVRMAQAQRRRARRLAERYADQRLPGAIDRHRQHGLSGKARLACGIKARRQGQHRHAAGHRVVPRQGHRRQRRYHQHQRGQQHRPQPASVRVPCASEVIPQHRHFSFRPSSCRSLRSAHRPCRFPGADAPAHPPTAAPPTAPPPDPGVGKR